MRLVPNFLELAFEIWPKPSSLSFLFSVICKGSGEAARICCLAWSFTARICHLYQIFLNWPIKFGWAFIFIRSFMRDFQMLWWDCANVLSCLILRCSHIPLIPNFLELAYKIWLSLHLYSIFSAIFKGSGETAQMCGLVWSFSTRLSDKYQTLMNWPIET